MSDCEIIDVIKTKSLKRKRQNEQTSSKRKRTSSGLIEKSETMKGTETEFEEFVIDRTITPQRKLAVKDVEKSQNGTEKISQWRKSLENTLLGSALIQKNEKHDTPRFRKSCFNCDGEHQLRDCPRPKDFRRISKKKRESGDATRRRQPVYDNVGLSKQKQNDFKPGEMSEKLRNALGLRNDDIPEHIYRMRRLGFIKGYPPGWLRKAIKTSDTLQFFTSESKKDEEKKEEPPELDKSKIIWYPGFNENNSNLKDRETFKVPSSEVFCSGYQEELAEIFKKQRKAVKKKSKAISRHKKFADEDDDIIIIDNEHTRKEESKFNTPGEEGIVIVLNECLPSSEGQEGAKTPTRSNVKVGESAFHIIGTPTYGLRNLPPVAPLESFAVGIQPFIADAEEVESKGTFRKLMENLKKAREHFLEPELEVEVQKSCAKEKAEKISLQSTESVSSFESKSEKVKKEKKKKKGNRSKKT
ncbi:hypothetical protein CRE_25541 [Caenorhabditis remanei]|uniref:PSP proline-rich domain-containing protein n=1 Tax=Caenorhabditis remanei TaxID=31234 RepID=E3LS56_CAERE|nr:hypothetical protein CRE_25541 [Caenorhabditis remanei]